LAEDSLLWERGKEALGRGQGLGGGIEPHVANLLEPVGQDVLDEPP
jgi:hypothetical protein